VAAPKTRFRRVLKWTVAVVLILLALPPLQIILTSFWNPTWSPMQIQRRLETHAAGQPMRWMALKDIPVAQIHFIWASEDQAFFQHHGFDLPQLHAAVQQSKKDGKKVRGASTITMQCARSVFLWQGRSYLRKGLEFYYTFWMELILSKKRILELYLNHIELGTGIYGIGAASENYFGKSPSQLTLPQMAALAAILPNPREWSPIKPDATVQRKIRRVERLASRAPFPADKLK